MNEAEVEAEIGALVQSKNLTAPRITPERIDDVIHDQAYYNFPGTNVTVCCLTLENGFNAVGTSACASDGNFDSDFGAQLAYEDARKKVFPLEAYLLCEDMMKQEMTAK